MKTYESDYVVVGGGSAGCVLANRLTEDPSSSLILLEAGPSDVGKWDSWKISMPAALTYNLADDKYNWAYSTTPQKHLNGRCIEQPRGRALGGSSSLNAMVYIRGHAKDYDRWVEEGADGWSYANCLPYFRKAQKHSEGADDYRGGEGPLGVTLGMKYQKNELFRVFIEAGVQAGYVETSDLNGYRQEGFGPLDSTTWDGKRCSASKAYLHPVKHRPNLQIFTDVLATEIILEGDTARGIRTIDKVTNEVIEYRAAKEVILAAGAINSPQLLMLSGIGDADELKEVGVESKLHLPGVGKNLQDHLDTYLQWKCKEPITLYAASFPHNMIKWGAEWFLRHSGMCSSAHLESGGFIRTRAGIEYPDLQFHFLPGALTGQLDPGGSHAFQVHCSTMRATSRGYIKLQTKDPGQAPIIDPNYFSTKQDIIDYRNSVRLTQEIVNQPAFDKYRGDAITPGDEIKSDSEIDAWVRETCHSAYHPCGACKMGSSDDPQAVVDSSGKVFGIDRLRVIDSSIMPSVVTGNLNAPTIMMAEKLSDQVRGHTPLPPSDAEVFIHADWEKSQR